METKYLRPENRPNIIKRQIDAAYDSIANDDSSKWGTYNGHNTYDEFVVSETYLLQYLINSNQDQKEFYILDVGAGNFQLGRYLAKFTNIQINNGILPSDITIYIISIRGESNYKAPYSQVQNCNIWEIGNFKIENLIEEFKNHQLGNLLEKFDLIVSNYALRHLVDPLGTFIQMHDLLKKGGIILTDAFDLHIKSDPIKEALVGTTVLLSYLIKSGDEILVRDGYDDRGYPRMAVKKYSDDLELPFNYDSVSYDDVRNSYSTTLISNEQPIHNEASKLVYNVMDATNGKSFAGSKSLFKELSSALLLQVQYELENDKLRLLDKSLLINKYNKDRYAQKEYTLDEYIAEEMSYKEKSIQRQIHDIELISECAFGNSISYEYNFHNYRFIGHNLRLSGNEEDL